MSSEQETFHLDNQAGLLWTWWRGDPLPALPPLPGLIIEEAISIDVLTDLMEASYEEIYHLSQQGHRPYIAYVDTLPAAVGWSAVGNAAFGGGRVTFYVSVQNRYLYNFITHPAFRGRGIYPRLLQYILSTESKENERFWIIHQLENVASQRGIEKAGFRIASQVYFLNTQNLGLVAPPNEFERAHAGSLLLGLPLIEKN